MSRRKRSNATTSQSAITATAAGSGVDSGGHNSIAWIVRASSVTTGGTVKIQGCETDSATDADWWDLATVTVSANGTQEVVVDSPPSYTRSNLTARTDGTYTTKYQTIDEVGK